MDQLKVCFIGVGSIARRHIRNLRNVCEERKITLTIDAFRRSSEQVDGVDQVYTSEVNLPTDYDAIFVTNPTDHHLEALKRFHDNGKNFFIEK